jgi:hypothetical protein
MWAKALGAFRPGRSTLSDKEREKTHMSIDSRELGVLRRVERVWDTPFLGAGESAYFVFPFIYLATNWGHCDPDKFVVLSRVGLHVRGQNLGVLPEVGEECIAGPAALDLHDVEWSATE